MAVSTTQAVSTGALAARVASAAPLTVRIIDGRLRSARAEEAALTAVAGDAGVDLGGRRQRPGPARRRHDRSLDRGAGRRGAEVRRLADPDPALGRRHRHRGRGARRRRGRAHEQGRAGPRPRVRHGRAHVDLAARARHRERRARSARSGSRPPRPSPTAIPTRCSTAGSRPRSPSWRWPGSARRRSTRPRRRLGCTAGPTRSPPGRAPAPGSASTSAPPTTSTATSSCCPRFQSLTDPTVVLPPLGPDTADLLGTSPHDAITLLDDASGTSPGAPGPSSPRTRPTSWSSPPPRSPTCSARASVRSTPPASTSTSRRRCSPTRSSSAGSS